MASSRLTARDIQEPFGSRDPLYRTGISVGDYPIDHHHKRHPEAPQHLWFFPVPSFSVPLGALIPEHVDGLVVADKAISVSNVANGTTRLQPVVLLTGQAAGALAALAVRQGREPRAVRRTRRPEGAHRGARLPAALPGRAAGPPPVRAHPARRRDGNPEGPGPGPPVGEPDVVLPGLPDRRRDASEGLAEFEPAGMPARGRTTAHGRAKRWRW